MIDGVIYTWLPRIEDERGYLIELFRDDELPEKFFPAMGYMSVTHPGIMRGPHEHIEQTDGFAFLSGKFEIHLWENRFGEEETYECVTAGVDNPLFLIVPPGVVHGYKNIGNTDAYVLNFPNKLYAGWGRTEKVDEIRHEDTEATFHMR